jgi:hypothetical protein
MGLQTDPKTIGWLKMSKEQTDDTTESGYKRGYRQGVQDALKTVELKTIEMDPRIEVWDWAAVKLAEWFAAGKINDRSEKPPQPRG